MNIVNCAMISAFILFHAGAPKGGQTDRLLRKIHDDKAHEMVLPNERKSKFTERTLPGMKNHRRAEPLSRNPYSWNMFYEYPDDSGYEDASPNAASVC